MSLQEAEETPQSPVDRAVLVAPAWLEAHLEDGSLRVVEVDVSPLAYSEGHIAGAVSWNVYRDLKDGNYRLVDRDAIEPLLSQSGIDKGTTIVFYGYAPAMGFWLMKLYGHHDVRILDCARDTWRSEGRPWTATVATPAPADYGLPEPDGSIRATPVDVARAIGDPARTILDVRSDLEYVGERFWPSGGQEAGGRAGHVPSAIHFPIDGLYDERGSFQSPADLRTRFSSVDLSGDNETIVYCTIGGRASTAWFVLTYLLGCDGVRVYDGSWAEWGRMTSTPVVGG